MVDINLKPLFAYLADEFEKINTKLDKVEERLDGLETGADGFAGIAKKTEEEQLIVSAQVDDAKKWVRQVSTKLDISIPEFASIGTYSAE